jgi:beta-lactamase regulating signal transducer with metallopeptidase domain
VTIDFRALIQQPALQALGWTLLHFLWQGAALGFVAFLLLRTAWPARASARYAIGVATLAFMLASCAATFITLSRAATPPASRVMQSVIPASSIQGATVTGLLIADLHANPTARSLFIPPPGDATPLRPQPLGPVPLFLIVAAWSLGVLILSFRLVGGWMLARRLARHAIDTASPALEASARDIAERLRLQRAVEIVESAAVAVPTLIGWVKPVVLFPASALAGLSPEQLQAILAHELAHVRRHDYLINLLQSVVETLLFYHPAVWWVSARVREEREHCCDDLAVDVCGDRFVYASALAELTTIAGQRGFALAATDGSLLARVRRILGGQQPVHETPPVWTALAMLAVVVGSAGALAASNDEPKRAHDIELQRSMATDQVLPPPPPPAPPSSWFDLPPVPPTPPPPALAPESAFPPLSPAPPPPQVPALSWIAPPAPLAPPAPSAWPAPPAPPLAPPAAVWPPERVLEVMEPPPAPPPPPSPLAVPPVPPLPPAPADQTGTKGNFVWTSSGYDQRRTLTPIMQTDPVSLEVAVAVLEATTTVNSSHDRGNILIDLAQRGGVTPPTSAAFMDLVRAMPSSYEQRRVLTAVAGQHPPGTVAAEAVKVAGAMKSSQHQAETLLEFIEGGGLTDPSADAFFASAAAISSSYDLGRVLKAVAAQPRISDRLVEGVVKTAASISSSHDRASVLVELANRQPVLGPARDLYEAAARDISSSWDQNRALAALARAERR